MSAALRPTVASCAACGTELAPRLLCCPSCRALVYAETLKQLASDADAAEQAEDLATSASLWRDALVLLPPDSRQHAAISERITALSRRIDQAGSRPSDETPRHPLRRGWAAAGAALLFLLSKLKLLLLGLTKASTLLSMLVYLGVYWRLWGWKFATGLVLSIYVHEMGHVAALARYGVQASAPMFIPGLGAVVRLKQPLTDRRQNARVGLAGPVWGLAAALAAYGMFVATGLQVWAAIAQMGGVINLFNLIPVWQLDGARGFHALSRTQRWIAVGTIAVAWALTAQGLLVLVGAAALFNAAGDAPDEWDHAALATYAALIAALAWLASLPVQALIG